MPLCNLHCKQCEWCSNGSKLSTIGGVRFEKCKQWKQCKQSKQYQQCNQYQQCKQCKQCAWWCYLHQFYDVNAWQCNYVLNNSCKRICYALIAVHHKICWAAHFEFCLWTHVKDIRTARLANVFDGVLTDLKSKLMLPLLHFAGVQKELKIPSLHLSSYEHIWGSSFATRAMD